MQLLKRIKRVLFGYDPDVERDLSAPPDEIDRLARTCVSTCREVYGVRLDYSVASIAVLEERVLEPMHLEYRASPISDNALTFRSAILGAYIGEVIRRSAFGSWESAPMGLKLRSGALILPTLWASGRIVDGVETEGLVFKVKAAISLGSMPTADA